MTEEQVAFGEDLRLILRGPDGKVKAVREKPRPTPEILKADLIIAIAEHVLGGDPVVMLLCPKCQYDKFRVNDNGTVICQKCDAVSKLIVDRKGKTCLG